MKRDHVTITYYEIRYPYYKEPGYEYIEAVKFKTRKYKRSKKEQIELNSQEYWDTYPHYPHQAWKRKYKKLVTYKKELWEGHSCLLVDRKKSKIYWEYTKPSYPQRPKRKRHYYLPGGFFPQLNCCPKAWNKLMHIRPNRRKWKRYCQKVTVSLQSYWYDFGADVEFMFIDYHPSEGIPYPSGKKHVYYY